MPDADKPSRLRRLETLIFTITDSNQLRRVITNAFGTRVMSQLPEVCSHELLARGTVTVLDRNGLINDDLFIELLDERPKMRAMIEEVAREHGVGNLPVPTDPPPRKRRRKAVSTPDFVVRDTYKRLLRQRTILRKLTHGELHVARLFDIVTRQETKAMKALPRRVVSWIEKHLHEFSLRELQSALTGVRTVAAMFVFSPKAGLLGSLVGLSTDSGRTAVKQLITFAELSEQDLYLLALKLVGQSDA